MAENNDFILSRRALTSLEAARDYVQRHEQATEDWAIADAINEATGYIELFTGRLLRERIFRNPVVITGLCTVDSVAVTAAGDFSTLKAGDDIVGNVLRPESVVAAIAGNNLSLTLNVPAAAGGAVSLTAGSAPLQFMWPGGNEASLPEWPVETVYSLSVIEADGTRRALDLTGLVLRKSPGIIVLNTERPTKGQWCEVECKAGYRPPSNTDVGHREDWSNLRRVCHRITQVLFQDYRHQLGRSLEVQLRDQLVRFADMRLPKDVEQVLNFYAREEM